jgi:anti-anti-sigma factor
VKQWPINEMTAWGLAGFRVDPMSGCVIVTVVGEVDVDSAVGLDTALQTAVTISPCLVLDMTRLEFMDSTGLGTLLVSRV